MPDLNVVLLVYVGLVHNAIIFFGKLQSFQIVCQKTCVKFGGFSKMKAISLKAGEKRNFSHLISFWINKCIPFLKRFWGMKLFFLSILTLRVGKISIKLWLFLKYIAILRIRLFMWFVVLLCQLPCNCLGFLVVRYLLSLFYDHYFGKYWWNHLEGYKIRLTTNSNFSALFSKLFRTEKSGRNINF